MFRVDLVYESFEKSKVEGSSWCVVQTRNECCRVRKFAVLAGREESKEAETFYTQLLGTEADLGSKRSVNGEL